MSTNPSHLLLSRNPRAPAHPQVAHTSTSRHSHSPPAHLWHDDVHHARPVSGGPPGREPSSTDFEVFATFRREATLPGTVKVIVDGHDFWCHKEVLFFASPFFEGLLQSR